MIRRRTTWSSRLVVVVVVLVGFFAGAGSRAYAVLFGDVNGDGFVNFSDVAPFLEVVLVGPHNEAADWATDGVINGVDIDGFASICDFGGCPHTVPPPIDGGNVYFSTVGTVGDGVTLGNPDIVHTVRESGGWLYIWATDERDFDDSIGMNVVSRAPDVVAFTTCEIFNPELLSDAFDPPSPSGVSRWQGVAVNDVTANTILRMNAARIGEATGITNDNDGTVPLFKLRDPLYDIGAGAFLLGMVQWSIVAPGVTHLSIDQESTALFVNGGHQIIPDFGTATIRVMPEVPPVLGDVNLDGAVNGLDVDPFVDRIVRGAFQFEADMNEDGWVNGLDVRPFVTIEIGGGTAVVPEPSTLVASLLGLIGIMSIRRQH